MGSIAVGWDGAKPSARLPWNATSATDCNTSSASGTRRPARRSWALTSISSPAAGASPPPCATSNITRSTSRAGPIGALPGALFPAPGGQSRGQGGVHGSVFSLPRPGPPALPQCAHCGGPLSRHPHHQSSLPGLLAGTGSGGQQEPRLALATAPSSPQPPARSTGAFSRLPGRLPGPGADLPLQTEALLLAVEETPYPQTVPGAGAALPPRRLRVAPGRPGATRATRSNPALVE